MQLRQILNIANTKNFWSCDSFGTDNVYADIGAESLVSYNATLGLTGSGNKNLADRAVNLRGGHLKVLNTNFLNSEIALKNFHIGFSMRIVGRDSSNPIIGFHPIISKWNPEQQFMIGFDSGNLVAKVQTTDGVVSVTFPHNKILYNDRFNCIQLRVTSTNIYLHVNGDVASTSLTGAISPTSTTLFTIGSEGSETLNADVYINDIFVADSSYTKLDDMVYSMTRTRQEKILDYNPTHFYDFSILTDLTKSVQNLGRSSAPAYIVSGSTPPEFMKSVSHVDKQYVRLYQGSWIAVDDIINYDVSGGFSLIINGGFSLTYNTNSTAQHQLVIADLRSNVTNNNDRMMIAYNSYYNDRYYSFLTYSSDGTQLDSYLNSGALSGATFNSYGTHGYKKFIFSGQDVKTGQYYLGSESSAQKTYNFTSQWAPSLPHESNRFWMANTQIDYADISELILFDYDVPDGLIKSVNYVRFKLMSQFLDEKYSNNLRSVVYGFGISDPDLRYMYKTSYNPLDTSSGYAYEYNLYDPIGNRLNDWTGSVKLVDQSDYIGGYTAENYYDIQTNNFTVSAFIWNRNATERYKLCRTINGEDIQIWMNSRNGQFSYGDVEVSSNRMNQDYTMSTSIKRFIDDGFHHIAFVRRGLKLELWVDGELVESTLAPTVNDITYNNNPFQFFGGLVYLNDIYIFNTDLSPYDIEALNFGFNDTISGQCTLDGSPLPSNILVSRELNGEVTNQHATDSDGKFSIRLPKTNDGERVSLIALPQDDNATNNVVVHGSYNTTTVYTKYTDEILTGKSVADMILDMEPYAFYKMDDTTGTTIVDHSGNGRDGTAYGGVTLDADGFEPGVKAIDFNGVDGYIDLPDGYDDLSNGFTAEAFVNYDRFLSWTRVFEFASGANGVNNLTITNYQSDNDVFALVKTPGNNVELRYDGFRIGTWAHVAIRIAPNGDISLWLNGSKVAEATVASLPANVLRTVNYLGRSSYSSDQYFDGRITHFATYMHPLSDEEIRKHAYRGYQLTLKTMRSTILVDKPIVYFTVDRGEEYVDVVSGNPLTQYGSFDIYKNSIVFNKQVIGNNYLSMPGIDLSDSNGYSIEFSIKTSSTHNDAVVVSEWDSSTETGKYKVMLDSTNKIKYFVNDSSNFIESSTLYNDGQWHHVVITGDEFGNIAMYVDGVIESTMMVNMVDVDANNFTIGNTSDGSSQYHFEARTELDDIAIYQHRLSSQRVSEHFERFTDKKVYQ